MFVLCNAGPGRMARMGHSSDIFRQAAAEAVAGYNSASSTEEEKRWRIGPRQVTLSKTDVHRWILTVSRRHQSRSKAASVCAINLDICGYDSHLPQVLVWSGLVQNGGLHLVCLYCCVKESASEVEHECSKEYWGCGM